MLSVRAVYVLSSLHLAYKITRISLVPLSGKVAESAGGGDHKFSSEVRMATQKLEKNTAASSELLAELRRVVEDHSKTAAQEWAKQIGELLRDVQQTKGVADRLHAMSINLVCGLVALAFVFGILGTLAFQRLFLH
jgi:hypothetical protein